MLTLVAIGNYDPDESWDEDNIRISAQGKLKMPPLLCKYHSGSLKGKVSPGTLWKGHTSNSQEEMDMLQQDGLGSDTLQRYNKT